jgi:hypothetical protein
MSKTKRDRDSNHLCAVVLTAALLICAKASLAITPLPGTRCNTLSPAESTPWTDQERWVWQQICEGRVADLQSKYGDTVAGGSRDQRVLTPLFLNTILLFEPYRSAIPRQGVQIRGAHFRDAVNLAGGELARDFSITDSNFDRDLDLQYLHARGSISLEKSRIVGPVNMEGLEVERNLNLSWVNMGAEDRGDIRLVGAQIKGNLWLWDSIVRLHLNMDSLSVGGHLEMSGRGGHRATYRSIWLQNASVGGELTLSDAAVENQFTNGLSLTLNGLSVGRALSLLNSTFSTIGIRDAKIGGNVRIEGPKEHLGTDPRVSIDLSGTSVGGALSLGSVDYGSVDWPEGTIVSLRNAAVFALRDGIECDPESICNGRWPSRLELDGFKYQALEADAPVDMAARPAQWWAGWLARQDRYSPQPYEQLASVLVNLGYKEKAKEVLYEGKNRELQAARYPQKLWLTLQCALIGYGYRLNRAWWWVVGFVLLGAAVLRLSGQGPRNKMPFGIAYSIDMLLPAIELRKEHYDIRLSGWARYYFYLHKMMGFVLASFVIAGLAGLTK